MGKPDEAIKTYEKLTSDKQAFYRDAATLEMARIHHAQGRSEQARTLLVAAKDEFPTSTLGASMDSLLKELGEAETAPTAAPKAEDKAE